MRKLTRTLLICASLSLAACQSNANENGVAAAGQTGAMLSPDESDAVQLAHALAQADRADAEGDATTLAQMVERIDRLGAQPAGEEEVALLAGWAERAGPLAPPLRGRLNGPGFQSGWIAAGHTIELEQVFLSGQRASIALETSRGPALAIEVDDGDTQEICAHSTARSACEWVPVFTRRHRIRLSNPGPGRTFFHLAME